MVKCTHGAHDALLVCPNFASNDGLRAQRRLRLLPSTAYDEGSKLILIVVLTAMFRSTTPCLVAKQVYAARVAMGLRLADKIAREIPVTEVRENDRECCTRKYQDKLVVVVVDIARPMLFPVDLKRELRSKAPPTLCLFSLLIGELRHDIYSSIRRESKPLSFRVHLVLIRCCVGPNVPLYVRRTSC